MFKITESYTDYDGNPRTEDFYFNFTEAEITKMQFGTTGGLAAMINRIVAAQDTPRLIEIFEDLIKNAYGIKSPDGRRFIKRPELTEEFTETEAYSQIYMRLATNAEAATEFVNNVVPKKQQEEAKTSVIPADFKK
ncbi:hypothetical protein [Lachnoclostridium sp. Marseille-P6806]|uniref:hypothetical protein n=1 Tax=Lachnoclostridium sp. Marseille-P6806 TaxID=2364793 RepID=UPI001030CD00|nr:hypothetical protein [Lachnoclostridium sp. Marseille-P6806]